jgi:hypothetical protein
LRATAPADLALTGWCLAIQREKADPVHKGRVAGAEDREADPAVRVASAGRGERPAAELAGLEDLLEAVEVAVAECLAGAAG